MCLPMINALTSLNARPSSPAALWMSSSLFSILDSSSTSNPNPRPKPSPIPPELDPSPEDDGRSAESASASSVRPSPISISWLMRAGESASSKGDPTGS